MDRMFLADGTSGSTALPSNNVTRAELIAWLEDIKANAGTVLTALEALAVTGPLTLTAVTDGAKTLSAAVATARAAMEDVTELTGSGAVDLTKRVTRLNAAAGNWLLSLANGLYQGQEVFIWAVDLAGSANWVASALTNVAGGTTFTLDASTNLLALKWDAATSKWFQFGGDGFIS